MLWSKVSKLWGTSGACLTPSRGFLITERIAVRETVTSYRGSANGTGETASRHNATAQLNDFSNNNASSEIVTRTLHDSCGIHDFHSISKTRSELMGYSRSLHCRAHVRTDSLLVAVMEIKT